MKFEKIKLDEARKVVDEFRPYMSDEELGRALETLKMPTRATEGSAGYDIRCPFDVIIHKGESRAIPLLIKVVGMSLHTALFVFNRSGLSLKHGLRIDNSVCVIDSDYDLCIWYQATAHTEDVVIRANDRICQGVFIDFLTVQDDKPRAKRKGGIGSTGK